MTPAYIDSKRVLSIVYVNFLRIPHLKEKKNVCIGRCKRHSRNAQIIISGRLSSGTELNH